jgi:hypothetical protein
MEPFFPGRRKGAHRDRLQEDIKCDCKNIKHRFYLQIRVIIIILNFLLLNKMSFSLLNNRSNQIQILEQKKIDSFFVWFCRVARTKDENCLGWPLLQWTDRMKVMLQLYGGFSEHQAQYKIGGLISSLISGCTQQSAILGHV